MKKALICPNEPAQSGYRVAQVELEENIFAVADPLYWMDCADEVVANYWYFDPVDSTIKEVYATSLPVNPIGGAPNVIA
jgi:hypothetical protein